MKKLAIIIQARMGSTRLTNKVLADIEGKTMLWHLVNRLSQSKYSPEIIIATTTLEADKQIIECVKKMNLKVYAGSSDDVLDRYYQASLKNKLEIIVRITADCPLIDPEIFDMVVREFLEGDYDYFTNTLPPTFPDGLDVEVFSFQALEKSWNEARYSSEREHVTPYIRNNDQIFKLGNIESEVDLKDMRWTVDEKEDLQFVREIFKNLYREGEIFLMNDILDLLKEQPELLEINNQFERNEGYLKSIKEDRIVK